MGLGGSETICRPPLLEDSGIAAIFVDLESNLDREFVYRQRREFVLSNPAVLSREACHADPNRARPPFPGTPVTGDVLAIREHVIGRAGCTGARLVSEVKDHSTDENGLGARLFHASPWVRCAARRLLGERLPPSLPPYIARRPPA